MFDNSLAKYLWQIFLKYKIYFCSLILVAICASILTVEVEYKIKEIIDKIIVDAGSNVKNLVGLFVLYKLMKHSMFFINRLLNLKFKPVLITETLADLYKKTLQHSLHWFDSKLSGEISNKISDFQDNLNSFISFSFATLINIVTIIISICYLFSLNKQSALVLLIFVVIYTPVIIYLVKINLRLLQQEMSAKQETLGIINDSISNVFGIKIIGNILTEFTLKLKPSILKWRMLDKKTRQFDAYYVDNFDTIMVTIMSATQIYLLVDLFKTGKITAGSFAFITIITLNTHDQLDQFLDNLLFNLNPAIASMRASYNFISTDIDVKDHQNSYVLGNVVGKIEFKNVNFAYPGSNSNIFNDLNLIIPAGQRIGIVGTSGAGKTTLVKCLLRYFDTQNGEILIDSHNITAITQESLRANISVIPQDITMFHRTIFENLQLAKHDATHDEIIKACKQANIHKAIIKMADGYNSIVGERGVKLSGGQRQRIAIARAILKNTPILILDEATSALDTPTELLIQQSFNEMFKLSKATTIVIAHRLSTLLNMDRIVVFDQGKVIEDGTHHELLLKDGAYKALWAVSSPQS